MTGSLITATRAGWSGTSSWAWRCWDARIAKIEGFPENLAMELRHLILSHHGTLEYGSPKRPKTLEALIVHYIDDLDAKVNAFQTFTSGTPDNESNWTPSTGCLNGISTRETALLMKAAVRSGDRFKPAFAFYRG